MPDNKTQPEHWWQSEFGRSLGHGIFLFLMLIGLGGCFMLGTRGDKVPLIQIQTR